MRILAIILIYVAASPAWASRVFDENTSNFLRRSAVIRDVEPMSIACWVKTNATDDFQSAFSIDNNAGSVSYYRVYLDNSAGTATRKHNGSAGSNSTATTVSTGTWHLIGGVFASDTSRTAYLDTTEGTEDTTSVTDNLNHDETNIGIGYDGSGTYLTSFDGKIAHCAIWFGVLSDTDFDDLAGGDCPTDVLDADSDGPEGYWKMDTDTGSTIPDEIASFDFTVNGTVAFDSDNPTVSCGGTAAAVRRHRGID